MFFQTRRGLRSRRRIKTQRRLFVTRGAVIFVVILLCVVVTTWVSRQPRFLIADVFFSGLSSVGEEEIEKEVRAELLGTYGLLFPRQSTFLYPRNAIEERILNIFPEILSVSVRRGTPTSLTIAIDERKPFALWCDLNHGETEEGKKSNPSCYFLDKTGVIFKKTPHFSNPLFMEFYSVTPETKVREGNAKDAPLGRQFLSEEEFGELLDFKQAFDNLGIPLEKFINTEDDTYEFVLQNNARIIFAKKALSEQGEVNPLLANLDGALRAEVVTIGDFVEMDSGLEYIDLRFDKKVYYKFK